jgi:hypothetical protein
LRAGMPGVPVYSLLLVCVLPIQSAHETAGAAGTRHSPRPSDGRKIYAQLGRIAPRDREVVSGIVWLLKVEVGVCVKRTSTSPRKTHSSCPDLIRASINLRKKKRMITGSSSPVMTISIGMIALCGAATRPLCHPSKSKSRTCNPHNSLALLNANDDTRLVFSSRISVRVIGGSARWLQFSRSQSRQLTPIGVPSVFSRSIPVA